MYDADWTIFISWCRRHAQVPLPAEPAVVAAWLTEDAGLLSLGTLTRRAAAIAARHRAAAVGSPTQATEVRSVLRAARKQAAPRRVPVPTSARLKAMAARCPGNLAGLRDRALLMLAADGLGRSDLVSLQTEGIEFRGDSMSITVPAREGVAARTIVVARDRRSPACPVKALETWLGVSGTGYGAVFRKVDRWQNVEHAALGADAIRRILTRRAVREAAASVG